MPPLYRAVPDKSQTRGQLKYLFSISPVFSVGQSIQPPHHIQQGGFILICKLTAAGHASQLGNAPKISLKFCTR